MQFKVNICSQNFRHLLCKKWAIYFMRLFSHQLYLYSWNIFFIQNKAEVNLCWVPGTAATVLMQSTLPGVFGLDSRSHHVHKSIAIAHCRRASIFWLGKKYRNFPLLRWHLYGSIKLETTFHIRGSQTFSECVSHISIQQDNLPSHWQSCGNINRSPVCHSHNLLRPTAAFGKDKRVILDIVLRGMLPMYNMATKNTGLVFA